MLLVTTPGYKDNDNTAYSWWYAPIRVAPGPLCPVTCQTLAINDLEVWNEYPPWFISHRRGRVLHRKHGGGTTGMRVGNDMPLIPMSDLEFNEPNMETGSRHLLAVDDDLPAGFLHPRAQCCGPCGR